MDWTRWCRQQDAAEKRQDIAQRDVRRALRGIPDTDSRRDHVAALLRPLATQRGYTQAMILEQARALLK